MGTITNKIPMKLISRIVVGNLLVLGMVACTSTSDKWMPADDSPWAAKHQAAAKDMQADAMNTESTLNDPVLLTDPEPAPIVIHEPMQEAMPAPVMEKHAMDHKPMESKAMAPVEVIVEEKTIEQEISELPGNYFAVQVYAGKSLESVEKFKKTRDLPDLKIVKTDHSGTIIFVLVDIQETRATAYTSAEKIAAETKANPWVRSVAGLQQMLAK